MGGVESTESRRWRSFAVATTWISLAVALILFTGCGDSAPSRASHSTPEAGSDAPGHQLDAPGHQLDAGQQDAARNSDASSADATLDAGCNVVCSNNNISPTCALDHCGGDCNAGFADCNDDKQADGCEVPTSADLVNCGGCGVVCPAPAHADAVCSEGKCGGTCLSGFADCNQRMDDGCETELATDVDHCGGCGKACSSNNIAARACTAGTCSGACASGFADCNTDKLGDGCEVSTDTDPAHCDGCGKACPALPHAQPSCTDAQCGGKCLPGFEDCNGKLDDGCEVDTATNPAHCGACQKACSTNNVVTPSCASSICTSTCAAFFADCNANKQTDGCETSVKADVVNCGGCGVVCAGSVGRGCVNGVCNPTCDDQIANQGEGDVDCAGPCPKCDIGRGCRTSGDCRSGVCKNAKCAPVACPRDFGLPGPPFVGTGDQPQAVAVADLNADGILDVVTANAQSDSVSILIGQGGGRFAPKADFPTGWLPVSVAVGDINGDGKPDLATANYHDHSVSVLLAQGGGAFAPKVDYTTDFGAQGVALADMDNDGKLDLVVAAFSIEVLLNDGNGTFRSRVPIYADGNHFAALAIGDMNRDGRRDIVALGSNRVYVLFSQNGSGTSFALSAFYGNVANPRSIALADFNGDAILDVAVANTTPENTVTALTTFLNAGNGTLGTGTKYGPAQSSYGTVATDFSGDGKPDIAIGSFNAERISVFINTGSGTFSAPADYLTNFSPYALASGDLNQDGKADLVAANYTSPRITMLLNRGSGLFATRTEYGTGAEQPLAVASGDVNGDGHLDLATVNPQPAEVGDNSVSVLLNDGTNSFGTATNYPTSKLPTGVVLADLNGDPALDLAVVADKTLSVFINRGNGTLAPRVDYATGAPSTSLIAADLDGDQKVDLATDDFGDIAAFYNRGDGTFAPKVTIRTNGIGAMPGGALSQTLAVGDLNGDGRPDLAHLQRSLVFGGEIPVVARVINEGGRKFRVSEPIILDTFAAAVVIGDLTGSRDMGIVVANQDATVTIEGVKYPTAFSPKALAIGEMNGDGYPDVVVGTWNASVQVFLGSASGTFSGGAEYSTTAGLPTLGLDLNGDGRLELVTHGHGSTIAVIPNLCLP